MSPPGDNYRWTEVSCLGCITFHQVVLKEPKSALSIHSPGWSPGKDGGSNYTAEELGQIFSNVSC